LVCAIDDDALSKRRPCPIQEPIREGFLTVIFKFAHLHHEAVASVCEERGKARICAQNDIQVLLI